MHKQAWTGLFFTTFLIHLLSIQLQWQEVRFITKPLLVLLLLGYFLTQVKHTPVNWKVGVSLALCFSWLGDVLLLFEANGAIFFILGLVSFLIAHVFYIVFFNKVRKEERQHFQPLFLVTVVVYYVALLGLLHAHLGDMKLPVYIYGVVICTMLLLTLHLYRVHQRQAGRLLLAGAILFVVSDSVLAVNKFYQPFAGAGIIIMGSYGLAQWLITEGSLRWLQARSIRQEPVLVPKIPL